MALTASLGISSSLALFQSTVAIVQDKVQIPCHGMVPSSSGPLLTSFYSLRKCFFSRKQLFPRKTYSRIAAWLYTICSLFLAPFLHSPLPRPAPRCSPRRPLRHVKPFPCVSPPTPADWCPPSLLQASSKNSCPFMLACLLITT